MWKGGVCGGLRLYYIVNNNDKFDMAWKGNRC